MIKTPLTALGNHQLSEGIRSRLCTDVNGLTMHILEAGFEPAGKPVIFLLHGFPELAFSWRKIMPLLARAGFHVIAPDLRGYGRTTGWDPDYDGNLASFGILNLMRDVVALVDALGCKCVQAIVGHDFGSPLAAYCALMRPDIFRSVVLMSAPFAGPPESVTDFTDLDEGLAALTRPRKHYQRYYCTRKANTNMTECPQGIATFLRAYFHYKSADWSDNAPHPLRSWAPQELAKMPTYYIMDLEAGMADTVAPFMPSSDEIATCSWFGENELAFYATEFGRTGFQGGLQWYRCIFDEKQQTDLSRLHTKTIDVPACFIAGESDWGVYQQPGAFDAMQSRACSKMCRVELIAGAGHWVQQEQPEEVFKILKRFLGETM